MNSEPKVAIIEKIPMLDIVWNIKQYAIMFMEIINKDPIIKFTKNNIKFKADAGAPKPNPPGNKIASNKTGTKRKTVFEMRSA